MIQKNLYTPPKTSIAKKNPKQNFKEEMGFFNF